MASGQEVNDLGYLLPSMSKGNIHCESQLHFGSEEDGFSFVFDGTDTLNIDPENANDVVRVGETTLADFRVDCTTATKDFLIDVSGDIMYCPPPAITYTATTDSTAGNNTITIAQILTGLYNRDCNGSARTDTLPTAALAVAGVADARVGSSLFWFVTNTSDAAETLTVAAGTGGTMLGGASATVAQGESAVFVINFTNVTSSSEAYDVYSLVSGTE